MKDTLCQDLAMIKSLALGATVCALALTACSGNDDSSASVDRGAAAATKFTLCVTNESSVAISSSGDGSPTQPEGFFLSPGGRECVSSSPGTDSVFQSMMSDTGPTWGTHYYIKDVGNSHSSTWEERFSTCGKTWKTTKPINEAVSCSGNPFQLSATFSSNSMGSTAELVFADQ